MRHLFPWLAIAVLGLWPFASEPVSAQAETKAAEQAEPAEPAEPAGQGKPVEVEPAASATLQDNVELRTRANGESGKSQERIDAISDDTDKLFTQYRSTLRQIESLRTYNRQMRELVASQEAELASVLGELGRIEDVAREVTPLMLRMIDALEAFVKLDVPFLREERTERVAKLREMMRRADVTDAEKYRRIMEAYQIENEYGRTIEAYRSTLRRGGQELTVNFLRVGRIALVYQTLDEAEAGVWNQETQTWEPLDTSHRSAIRQGLRIARKQAAPDLIRLPLPAATNAGGGV